MKLKESNIRTVHDKNYLTADHDKSTFKLLTSTIWSIDFTLVGSVKDIVMAKL